MSHTKRISASLLAAALLFGGGWISGSQSANMADINPVAVEAQSVAASDQSQPYGIGLEAQCNSTPIVCVPSYLWTPTPIVPLDTPSAAASLTRTPTVRPTATPAVSATARGSATPTQVAPVTPTVTPTRTPTFTPTPTNTSGCAVYPCVTDVQFTYVVIRRVALCFTADPCGSGEMNFDRYRFRDVGERVAVQCLIEYTRGGNLWGNEHPCDDNPNGRWSAIWHNGIEYMKFVED